MLALILFVATENAPTWQTNQLSLRCNCMLQLAQPVSQVNQVQEPMAI